MIMELYILIFLFSLAWFVSIFFMESSTSIAIYLTKDKEKLNRIFLITASIWPIVSTSLVYLVVALETFFAYALIATGQVFYLALILLGIFVGIRSYLLGAAEGAFDIEKNNIIEKILKFYPIVLLLVAFLAISIFTSLLTGFGIKLNIPLSELINVIQSQNSQTVINANNIFSVNYYEMLFNGFNISITLSIVLYIIYFTVIFYNLEDKIELALGALTLSIIIWLIELYYYIHPLFIQSITSILFWIFVILSYSYAFILHVNKKIKYNEATIVILTIFGAFIFGIIDQGKILWNLVNNGAPITLLSSNNQILYYGSIVMLLAGLLVIFGVSAISYKVFYQKILQKSNNQK